MQEIEKLIKELEWTTIFTKADMLKAFELGKKVKTDELKNKIQGMVVNGTCQGIITEKDLE
jgi:uncharacterized protein (UPF0303 family)